jgi:hypothetical protein
LNSFQKISFKSITEIFVLNQRFVIFIVFLLQLSLFIFQVSFISKSHTQIFTLAFDIFIDEIDIERGFILFGTKISCLASIIETLLSSFKAGHVLNVKL